MTTTAILGMAVAQRPGASGHARLAVDWLLGLQAIGLAPLLVDHIDQTQGDVDAGVRWVAEVMAAAGLDDAWTVMLADGTHAGRSPVQTRTHARDAVVIDVMGYLGDRLDGTAARAYLDVDPGFCQCWAELGWMTPRRGYDRYFTVGLAAGTSSWGAPDDGNEWEPLPPPVALDRWPVAAGPGSCITTVATWRGPYDAVRLGDRQLGLRAHAMRSLAALPSKVSARAPFEMVLDIAPEDAGDADALAHWGWRLRKPSHVDTLARYHGFISGSVAEICVAKHLYTALHTGWFSDRSACYLAAGRPVVMSDTGVGAVLPTGDGLLVFDGLDGAAEAVGDVLTRTAWHRDAARSIAVDHLDATVVARRACTATLGALR